MTPALTVVVALALIAVMPARRVRAQREACIRACRFPPGRFDVTGCSTLFAIPPPR